MEISIAGLWVCVVKGHVPHGDVMLVLYVIRSEPPSETARVLGLRRPGGFSLCRHGDSQAVGVRGGGDVRRGVHFGAQVHALSQSVDQTFSGKSKNSHVLGQGWQKYIE